jgi:hypothetical protein
VPAADTRSTTLSRKQQALFSDVVRVLLPYPNTSIGHVSPGDSLQHLGSAILAFKGSSSNALQYWHLVDPKIVVKCSIRGCTWLSGPMADIGPHDVWVLMFRQDVACFRHCRRCCAQMLIRLSSDVQLWNPITGCCC